MNIVFPYADFSECQLQSQYTQGYVAEDTKVKIKEKVDTITDSGYSLVLHNDEVNTFDWVIQSLIEICKHNVYQAEQCALIIHNKGKYAVKSGSKEELKKMRHAFIDRGISATVE